MIVPQRGRAAKEGWATWLTAICAAGKPHRSLRMVNRRNEAILARQVFRRSRVQERRLPAESPPLPAHTQWPAPASSRARPARGLPAPRPPTSLALLPSGGHTPAEPSAALALRPLLAAPPLHPT